MASFPEGSGSEYEDETDFAARNSRKRARFPKPSTSKRARQQLIQSGGNVLLFDIVRQGKTTISSVVDDWIDAYQSDRSTALLELIQFFINASGCKGTVTAGMLEEATDGFQDIIKKMTEEFDEDSGDYPLITSGILYKRFKTNFCEFVQVLVRQCQYQIIYDQYMMENVLTLLTELSNSQVRAFRHTSTLAAMKLMTGLVNVALQISVSLDNTQRQYDAERNKDINKRASGKLDILLEKRKELEEQQNDIETMLNGIFKGIYVHRYRDYIADIRAICMEEIGCWMKMFPKVFLTDSYLKYVGWTLHDKQKEVRMKCLQSLIGLYSNTELMSDLKLFTSRFKDRIVSMILDKEYDVAVHAIKLLVLINNNCNYKVLSDQDSDSIFQLVYSCHRPVAVAAAEFLNIQLFLNKEYTPVYTKRGRRRSSNAPLLADLVLFYIESELHEHATYLVDSLWDVASGILKDFECMSDMLLEEPYDNDKMDDKQETALVDIMVSAVKQAAEGVPPSGRQGYHKKAGNREKRLAIEDKIRLTEHFILQIPKLLSKFQMDKDKVVGLLQIPRYFDLEYYTTGRREKHLEDLLEQMITIVEKHSHPEVLEQASRTFKYLCDEEYSIYSTVSHKRRTLIDLWAERFQLYFGIFQEAGDEPDDEEIYNTVQAIKKLTYLYTFNDLTSWKLYQPVNEILKIYNERADSVPETLLREACKFIYYDLVYGLAKAKKQSENNGLDASQQDYIINISDLRQRVSEYIRNCESLLNYCPHKSVQEECYMATTDILVIFSIQLAYSNPTLKPLVQKASDQLQHALLDFVRDFVFIVIDEEEDEDDTAKIDALHKRRSLLAAVCKLFVFNMIDLTLASSIFQQYIRFYTDYGDIIKETISRSRHHNKLRCAQTLALSLMTLFRETVREQGGVLDHSSQEYAHMKELARRFALTFGLDQVKTRDAVAELHKEGILFALKREDGEEDSETIVPPNLSFLGILVEFSAKLMRQDKKTVVQYLDKHIKSSMLSNQDQDWIPLVTYRNSLLQGADDDNIKAPAPPKGRRGRKKKGLTDTDNDNNVQATRPMTPQTHRPMTPQTHRPITPQQVHNTMSNRQMQGSINPQQAATTSLTPQQIHSPLPQSPMTPQPQPHHGRMTPQQGQASQPHHTINPQSLLAPQHQITMQVMTPQEGISSTQLQPTVIRTNNNIRQIYEDHTMSYHEQQQRNMMKVQQAMVQQQANLVNPRYTGEYQQQTQIPQHQVNMQYNITSSQAASPMPANAQYIHSTIPNNIVYDPNSPFQTATANIQQTPQQSPFYGN